MERSHSGEDHTPSHAYQGDPRDWAARVEWAYRIPVKLTVTQASVLVYVAFRGRCEVTNPAIAAAIHADVSGVREALRTLEALGLIVCLWRSPGGRGRPSVYAIKTREHLAGFDAGNPLEGRPKPANSSSETRELLAPQPKDNPREHTPLPPADRNARLTPAQVGRWCEENDGEAIREWALSTCEHPTPRVLRKALETARARSARPAPSPVVIRKDGKVWIPGSGWGEAAR